MTRDRAPSTPRARAERILARDGFDPRAPDAAAALDALFAPCQHANWWMLGDTCEALIALARARTP